MNSKLDNDLLSFFPDRKKTDRLAPGDILTVIYEPEPLLDEEPEEDITDMPFSGEDEEPEETLIAEAMLETDSALLQQGKEQGDVDLIDDPVFAYLRDIGKVKLITANEERGALF
jgi:hypothetical protein